mgnify:CR=1 FL=1
MLTAGSISLSDSLVDFFNQTGFAGATWGNIAMILVAFLLLYLAIKHKFEPLLLFTIAFGMLLTNLPGANMFHSELFAGGHIHWGSFIQDAGLLDYLYLGVKLGIYPCLIFIGVGAMTDFGPLIANPKSFMLGAAAQLGIFVTFLGAYALGFTPAQAGSIGIIGGADGPTAIFLTARLAPELLGPIAVAAYSYMALVPVIQPPIMRLLTTKKEREIKMSQLRPVSKTEKILFPIIIAVIISLLLPSAAPLIGCLMLGNLMKECGVVDRLSKTVQNELMNIVVIFLGITVGATATAEAFINVQTLSILVLGVLAFAACQVYEPLPPGGQEDEPADRLRRCFCGSYGSPRIANRRPGGQSEQLPAHARHGSERSRCRRLCGCRRYSAVVPGIVRGFYRLKRAVLQTVLFFFLGKKVADAYIGCGVPIGNYIF